MYAKKKVCLRQQKRMEIFKVSKSHIHLLLADDSILFLKATKNNATVTQQILSEYCEASRQLVNLVKSSIFFCKACPQTVCDEMRLITKVENESLNEKYLGLPTDVVQCLMVLLSILRTGYGTKSKVGLKKLYRLEGRMFS